MSEPILVSIIVPVYNAARFLQRCVESVLRQTYQHFELLLIDDGSTDNSGEICDRYALLDSRIRVFHKPNGGVSSARNYGMLRIRGGYLTFIDSDDWVDETFLQDFMDNAHVYDWVMQGIKNVDSHGKLIKILSCEEIIQAHTRDEVDLMLANTPAFGWVSNKFFKASIIQQHNLQFITTSSINEDRVFNLEYSQYIYSFLMLPVARYNYVDNPSSLTHSYVHPNMFINTAKEYDKILKAGKLGRNMSTYVGRFSIRFYVHTMGLCIVSPFSKLCLSQRCSLFVKTLKSLLSSHVLRQYKFSAIKWGIEDFYVYARKILMRK